MMRHHLGILNFTILKRIIRIVFKLNTIQPVADESRRGEIFGRPTGPWPLGTPQRNNNLLLQ